MITKFLVSGQFKISVECSCVKEHSENCEYDGELKYEAADKALKENVEVLYEEFEEIN